MDRSHQRAAAFFATVCAGLALMAGLALWAVCCGSYSGITALWPSIALVAGLVGALRFGWAAYTTRIPPWMAAFFERGDGGSAP